MARNYRMGKRAEDRDQTRARILQATMQVHDEKGIVPTTFADIAERAGVSQATVSRHFSTYGELVRTCGGHVWQEMQPPVPPMAPEFFAGVPKAEARIERLVDYVDDFYRRGAHRLDLASRDRALMPEIDGFLSAVEAGIGAFVAEALAPLSPSPQQVSIAAALMSFRVWQNISATGLEGPDLTRFRVRLLHCALKAATPSAH